MNIHEYQAKELLSRFGLNIPKGKLCYTPVEAEWAARSFGPGKLSIVKAQVHAGGRGKGGGVKLARTPDEARDLAQKIIGMQLVTPQTGPQGKKVSKVLVAEGSDIDKEFYLSLVVNRENATIGVMASTEGGMDIEEVAEKHPEKIITASIDPTVVDFNGDVMANTVRHLAYSLGFTGDLIKQFDKTLKGLFRAFMKYDCSMIEINPLAITKDGQMQILDCKMAFDENALFRHPDINDLRDYEEEDARELEASKFGLSYVALEGNIGCLVNGAGLAMGTMDIIKQCGGEPANFLDVGGGANQETVTQAFRIILRDSAVKGIFVNIFGGIMKCDVIANGIVAAVKELGLKVPLVVRLEGTNVELGKKILNESNLNIISANSMGDGAEKIVKAVR